MSIYNSIIIKANLPLSDSIGGIKVSILDFANVLVEGHKGIIKYSHTEILVKITKGELLISGTQLQLKEINEDEILITGDIDCLSRQRYDK